jgi:hypothetical protein
LAKGLEEEEKAPKPEEENGLGTVELEPAAKGDAERAAPNGEAEEEKLEKVACGFLAGAGRVSSVGAVTTGTGEDESDKVYKT